MTPITWVVRRHCSPGIQKAPKSLVKVSMCNTAMSYALHGGRRSPAKEPEACVDKMLEEANGRL